MNNKYKMVTLNTNLGVHSQQVRSLFIAAVVLASVGFLSKLAGAAGLGMIDPVKALESQIARRVGGQLGAARIASVLNFLLDSLISLAVILLAVGVGLLNGYFDSHVDADSGKDSDSGKDDTLPMLGIAP